MIMEARTLVVAFVGAPLSGVTESIKWIATYCGQPQRDVSTQLYRFGDVAVSAHEGVLLRLTPLRSLRPSPSCRDLTTVDALNLELSRDRFQLACAAAIVYTFDAQRIRMPSNLDVLQFVEHYLEASQSQMTRLVQLNKVDILDTVHAPDLPNTATRFEVYETSATTGEGMEALLRRILSLNPSE